jgi:hypothetical protein
MTRTCLSRLLAAAMFQCVAAHAQSSPELREILDRLQKLEQSNRDLTQEVHALRQELAEARGQNPQAAPAPAPAQDVQDQLAVDKARIDEMAQSKVESGEKMPLRITGMALFNAYANGRFNGGAGDGTIASLTQGDATGGATLRQTIIGLEYDGPLSVLGASVSGAVDLDLFGGSANTLGNLIRLRTADISFDWGSTSLLFGQEKPIISPRDPTSLAQVGVSPLTGEGNLWLWLPQVRVEQRVRLGENSGIRLQAGLVSTRELGSESNGYSSYLPAPPIAGLPSERPDPAVETRIEFWHRWGETHRFEIAQGFHDNRSFVGANSVTSRVYSVDGLFRPLDHLELSGFFYTGQNVADLGALPQGFSFYEGLYAGAKPVESTGGWFQVRVPVTPRLAFDFYAGRQGDNHADLTAGYIGLNAGYFANSIYQIAPNVFVSLELGQVRTTYITTGNRLNNHYDLALGYKF